MKVSLIKQKGIKLSQTTALRGLVECWLSGAMELARKKDPRANFLCATILRQSAKLDALRNICRAQSETMCIQVIFVHSIVQKSTDHGKLSDKFCVRVEETASSNSVN